MAQPMQHQNSVVIPFPAPKRRAGASVTQFGERMPGVLVQFTRTAWFDRAMPGWGGHIGAEHTCAFFDVVRIAPDAPWQIQNVVARALGRDNDLTVDQRLFIADALHEAAIELAMDGHAALAAGTQRLAHLVGEWSPDLRAHNQ